MSLTLDDLQQIKAIVQDSLKQELEPIKGSIEALENDVKELYFMLAAK